MNNVKTITSQASSPKPAKRCIFGDMALNIARSVTIEPDAVAVGIMPIRGFRNRCI